jgi:hypothetical protein
VRVSCPAGAFIWPGVRVGHVTTVKDVETLGEVRQYPQPAPSLPTQDSPTQIKGSERIGPTGERERSGGRPEMSPFPPPPLLVVLCLRWR